MLVGASSPFGSAARTAVLVALELLGESYARELARLSGNHLASVQAALRGLERDGLVAGRAAGRTRLFRLSPRYFALAELRGFLRRLSEAEPEIVSRVEQLRRRPRRTGKPL
jgi:DNA-binding transcriptional ArsR family regulator